MKKLLLALLALVVILLALVLAHPLWIGPVVRTVVTAVVPKVLGVPAQMDGFSLNVYTGRFVIDGFVLDNPPACGQEKFVKIGHLCLDVDPLTVCSNPIVVDEISVQDFYVSLMTDEKNVYNYEIVANGSKEKTSAAETKSEKPAKAEPESKSRSKPAPKVIIDLIEIQNATVQWKKNLLPLPSFRMTGIGRSVDGVEFEVAWQEFEKQFIASFSPQVNALQNGLTGAQKAMDKATKSLNGATKSVTDLVTKSVGGTTTAASSATQTVTDSSKRALQTTKKTLDDGVKSLKSLFK